MIPVSSGKKVYVYTLEGKPHGTSHHTQQRIILIQSATHIQQLTAFSNFLIFLTFKEYINKDVFLS